MFPDLPFEFVVYGTAVSYSAGNPSSKARWRQTIRDAAKEVLPEGHFTLEDPVSVTIYFFPQAEMKADIDNCAKPILDAMSRFVYADDSQVDRIVVQKFEPERPLEVRGDPTEILATALAAMEPVVYIKVGTDLHGE